MQGLNRISSYLLLSLNIFLLFLLFFRETVQLPIVLEWVGRGHVLFLHLPIGFICLLPILYWIRKELSPELFEKLFLFFLNLCGISAAISGILGFFLSKEGGYDEQILCLHQYLGVFTSVIVYLFVLFFYKIQSSKLLYVVLLVFISVILTGHFGGAITHGEAFLWEKIQNPAAKEENLNRSAFELAVLPIIKEKCQNCHNDKKSKGGLNLTDVSKILKGGKNGPLWKVGDALNSHIIERANLPLDDKKHMPPKGKPQLTKEEMAILSAWINEGASIKKKISEYGEKSLFKSLIAKQNTETTTLSYEFAAASESNLGAVNTPFCTVFPLASNSPALHADFFVSKKFDRKSLENLSKVSTQLVSLNLSKMPVKDEDLPLIAKLENLERLNLNQTNISGKNLNLLKELQQLQSLSLAGTPIAIGHLQEILSLPKLKELYLWNTGVSEGQLTDLKKKYSKISFNVGVKDNPEEKLTLNPPILKNENFIIKGNTGVELKHTLKNVDIRYTLDGSDPDSTTQTIYQKPIVIHEYTVLKALATKNNWLASKQVNYRFFRSNFTPNESQMLSPPNPKYQGLGAKSLIDLKKGQTDNFQENSWIGFREEKMNVLFSFSDKIKINGLTISYLQKMDSYIMPPEYVEVWGGDSPSSLTLLKKIPLQMPLKMEPNANLGINIPLPESKMKYYRLLIKPIAVLPKWHPGKGDKAWFFVDEVFFY